MLPPFIIEQIRKREEEAGRVGQEQPQLELPIPRPRAPKPESSEDEGGRGVYILDL